MVKIILKSFKDGIADLHCLPNGKEENSFDIRLDVINKKLISSTKEKDNYMIHAIYKIYEIYDETNTIPKMAISVCY